MNEKSFANVFDDGMGGGEGCNNESENVYSNLISEMFPHLIALHVKKTSAQPFIPMNSRSKITFAWLDEVLMGIMTRSSWLKSWKLRALLTADSDYHYKVSSRAFHLWIDLLAWHLSNGFYLQLYRSLPFLIPSPGKKGKVDHEFFNR